MKCALVLVFFFPPIFFPLGPKLFSSNSNHWWTRRTTSVCISFVSLVIIIIIFQSFSPKSSLHVCLVLVMRDIRVQIHILVNQRLLLQHRLLQHRLLQHHHLHPQAVFQARPSRIISRSLVTFSCYQIRLFRSL